MISQKKFVSNYLIGTCPCFREISFLLKIGKYLKPVQTDGQLVADADVVGAFPNDVVANDDIPFHRYFMKDLDISLKN